MTPAREQPIGACGSHDSHLRVAYADHEERRVRYGAECIACGLRLERTERLHVISLLDRRRNTRGVLHYCGECCPECEVNDG